MVWAQDLQLPLLVDVAQLVTSLLHAELIAELPIQKFHGRGPFPVEQVNVPTNLGQRDLGGHFNMFLAAMAEEHGAEIFLKQFVSEFNCEHAQLYCPGEMLHLNGHLSKAM